MPAATPAVTDAVPLAPRHLPDDIIQLVFEHILLTTQRNKPESTSIARDYLSNGEYLTLSKRFYRLLRPTRLRELRAIKSATGVSIVLAKVALDAVSKAGLRDLAITIFPDFSPLHAFAISQLENIRTLEIESDAAVPRSDDTRVTVSAELWDSITSLPRLHRLAWLNPIDVGDKQPQPVPSLRIVQTHCVSLSAAWTRFLEQSGVQNLDIIVDGYIFFRRMGPLMRPELVQSLHKAKFRVSRSEERGTNLLCAVQDAYNLMDVQRNFARVSRSWTIAGALSRPADSYLLSSVVGAVLHGTTSLTFSHELEALSQVQYLDRLLPQGLRQNGLRQLILDFPLCLKNQYGDCVEFVHAFKGLEEVRLLRLRIDSPVRLLLGTTRSLADMSDAAFAVNHPHLSALVRALETTSIKAFYVDTKVEEGSARWLRDDPSEPFECRAW